MLKNILKKIFGRPETKTEVSKTDQKDSKQRRDEGRPQRQQSRREQHEHPSQDGRSRNHRAGHPAQGDRGRPRKGQKPEERQEQAKNVGRENSRKTGRNARFEKRQGEERKPHPEKKRLPEKTEHPSHEETKWDPSTYVVAPAEGKSRFQDFSIRPEVLHAIADLGFKYCTPIQAGILPNVLDGLDAAGRAQTGTGKTAAFLIAIITRLLNNPLNEQHRKAPRALILAPTRELAMQIRKDADALVKYTDLKVLAVLGGMEYREQKAVLAEGKVDIVVATPGRLLDFKKQGNIHLDKVEILVIDEADRMLDMGFIPDVRRIIESTPPKSKRQTMLFSATLTPEVNRLAARWTTEPSIVEIEPERVVVKTIKQVFYLTTDIEKFKILYNLVTKRGLNRVIVFANRKDTARDLKDHLTSHGINCSLLSGDVEQLRRIKRLENFRSGSINVLVATDVAARGLHVEGISHVVNFTLPENPEDYVHRIGRTGRAGATGTSISFATETDAYFLPAIKEYLGEDIPSTYPEDDLLTPLPEPKFPLPKRTRQNRGRGKHNGHRSYGRTEHHDRKSEKK